MPREMKYRDACKILSDNGFRYIRAKGSHYVYSNGKRIVIVPVHSGTVSKGVMNNVMKEARLSINS